MRTPILAALLLSLPTLACFWRRGEPEPEPEPAQAAITSGPCARAAEIQQRLDDSTRSAQIAIPSGSYVLARYYIDAAGQPQPQTFEVIRTSDSRLIKQTRKMAAKKRYRPFEPMPGCPVRGLVMESFIFPTREQPAR